jgi:hypothetical protein
MSSVLISVANLRTYDDTYVRPKPEPLSRLGGRRNLGHVHGRVTIEIAGRAVPHLGHLGPDDVCLNTWLVGLCNAVNALAETGGKYIFDEGEQGQPAFSFERLGMRFSSPSTSPCWAKAQLIPNGSEFDSRTKTFAPPSVLFSTTFGRNFSGKLLTRASDGGRAKPISPRKWPRSSTELRATALPHPRAGE